MRPLLVVLGPPYSEKAARRAEAMCRFLMRLLAVFNSRDQIPSLKHCKCIVHHLCAPLLSTKIMRAYFVVPYVNKKIFYRIFKFVKDLFYCVHMSVEPTEASGRNQILGAGVTGRL